MTNFKLKRLADGRFDTPTLVVDICTYVGKNKLSLQHATHFVAEAFNDANIYMTWEIAEAMVKPSFKFYQVMYQK